MNGRRKRSECMTCSYVKYKDELRVFCSFCMKKILERKKPDGSREVGMSMASTAEQTDSAAGLEA